MLQLVVANAGYCFPLPTPLSCMINTLLYLAGGKHLRYLQFAGPRARAGSDESVELAAGAV